MTKKSTYGIFMKKVVHDMIEKGLLHKLYRKWKNSKQDCKPLIRTRKPIGIEKLASAFIILLFGILTAIILSYLENYVAHQLLYDKPKIEKINQYKRDVQKIEKLIPELDNDIMKKDVERMLLIIRKLYIK